VNVAVCSDDGKCRELSGGLPLILKLPAARWSGEVRKMILVPISASVGVRKVFLVPIGTSVGVRKVFLVPFGASVGVRKVF
jgi:hypothetical protein